MLDKFLILLALVVVAALSPAIANDPSPTCFAGVHAGSGGLGANGGCRLSSQFVLRFSVEGASQDLERTLDGVDYDADLEIGFSRLQLDYFPADSGFFVTGGLVDTDLRGEGTANPSSSVLIGSTLVSPANLGFLEMSAGLEGIEPYVGLGWLNYFGRNFVLRSEIGVSSFPGIEVTLVERETNFIPQEDIDAEVDQALDDIEENLIAYPYLRVGLEYRFR